MITNNRTVLIILIIFNAVVLLGQIYPEGAPPFARIVNIIFLIGSFIFFITHLIKQKETKD
jgi:hypothetical membrane protein